MMRKPYVFIGVLVMVLSLGLCAGSSRASGADAYSTPTMSPLFGPPPYEYRDNWGITVVFKTKPEVLKSLVPEPLVPNSDGIMFVTISRFFVSGFGSYNELIFGAPVNYGDRVVNYSLYLMLDNDIPIGAGREIWGFPKKLARVELTEQDGILTGTVERGGILLVKACVSIDALGKPEDAAGSAEYVNLKLIPSVRKDAPPDVMQLTTTTLENVELKQVYKGRATLEFGMSPADAFHEIPVVEVLGGLYVNSDFTLTYGEVLHDYLKEK